MLDTNAINYSITKLQSAFTQISPKIGELSQSYIKFKVFSQCAETVFIFFALIISLIIFIPIFKYGKGKNKEYNRYDEEGFLIPFVMNSIVFIAIFIALICSSYYTILAIKFPEMYVIQSLIQK